MEIFQVQRSILTPNGWKVVETVYCSTQQLAIRERDKFITSIGKTNDDFAEYEQYPSLISKDGHMRMTIHIVYVVTA